MTYDVSINYFDFKFDDLAEACTFCKLALNGNPRLRVTLEFITDFEEENTTDEEN